MMLRVLFVALVTCFTTGEALFGFYHFDNFELTSTPLLTSPLTLRCNMDVDYGAIIIDMTIRKKVKTGYMWLAYASMVSGVQTNSYVDSNAVATGYIGPSSYLEVSWPDVPEEEGFGEYECAVMFGTLGRMQVVRTNELEVGSIEQLMEMIRELEENGGGFSDDGVILTVDSDGGVAGGEDSGQDVARDDASSQDVARDDASSQDVARDDASNQDVTDAGASNQDFTNDGANEQDVSSSGASANNVVGSGVTQEEFDALSDRIDDLVDQLNSLADAQGGTGPDVQGTLDSLSEQVITFQQSRQQASDEMGNQIDSLSQQTGSLLETLSNDGMQDRINALTQQLSSIQTATENVQGLNGQVNNVTRQIEELSADLDNPINLNDTLEAVELQVNDLEAFLSSKPNLCDLRSLVWPQGRYTLLMPRTGCPQSELVPWQPGNRTHFTETSSGDNQNDNSTADHMPLNLFTVNADGNNLATLSFCTHILTGPGVIGFPSGSYCFHRRNNRCPDVQFTVGQLTIDDEEGARVNARAGALPQGQYNRNTVYYFCCRNDGPPSMAIRLPTAKPFYLYRYGGQCQSVYGMNVTNDYIVIDTSNGDVSDLPNIDAVSGTVPDGEINNLRLELCYYERW